MAIEGWTPTAHATHPITMGHEGMGFVQKLGSKVTGFELGDRVGFLYIKGCCCTYTVFFSLVPRKTVYQRLGFPLRKPGSLLTAS